ncbi:hypothetical protein HN51_064669 [Arachis hypogaea]|uniref:Protein RALF-like 24 n=2 Tax=Arachis TaxID=3817 RepID=A0A444ZBT9_ARAHY|nr:Protein RALF-like [Arachis hypogaea]RYR11624.1 hypothetical protein Ahy_B04g069124 [Arachis hypogaea]
MSQPRFTSMTLVVLVLLVLFSHTHSLSSSSMDLNTSDLNAVSRRVCRKSIVECLAENEMMDSESNRRILAMQQQKRYISYDTLKRDMVPCDRAGASYYNCHARQANPYNRGCEVITACARGVQASHN